VKKMQIKFFKTPYGYLILNYSLKCNLKISIILNNQKC